MAKNNQVPAVFARTTRFGVPYVAVLATWLIGCLAYLNVSNDGATVFTWCMNISTISGFIAWIVIMITYLRFRSAMEFHNLLQNLPFWTPLQPYSTWVALFILTILILTIGFHIFFPDNWSASNFLVAYIMLPIFGIMYLNHKIWFRTPLARRIPDIDAFTRKREMDELEARNVPPVAKNWLQKIWFWIA